MHVHHPAPFDVAAFEAQVDVFRRGMTRAQQRVLEIEAGLDMLQEMQHRWHERNVALLTVVRSLQEEESAGTHP